MNNIITQTKTLHAEMKTMKSAWDSDTSAKQKAAQQTKMLKDQIALQEQKLAQANNMLDKATAKYGENSNQALRWRQAVANARTELNNLNNELRNTPNQDPERGKGSHICRQNNDNTCHSPDRGYGRRSSQSDFGF